MRGSAQHSCGQRQLMVCRRDVRFDVVLNNLVARAMTTGPIFLRSDGTLWRRVVYIEDISCAFLAALHVRDRRPYRVNFSRIANVLPEFLPYRTLDREPISYTRALLPRGSQSGILRGLAITGQHLLRHSRPLVYLVGIYVHFWRQQNAALHGLSLLDWGIR
jgi:hypothetical protein